MNKGQKYLDIIPTLLSSRVSALLDRGWRGKLLRKLIVLKAFLRREIMLREVIENIGRAALYILPDKIKYRFMKRIKSDAMEKLILYEVFGDLPMNPVRFFDSRLYFLPEEKINTRDKFLYFDGLNQLIREIVIADQYCAKEFIKTDSIVVDVGANIGIFSLFAATLQLKEKFMLLSR